jgi:hypothetical protein
MQQAGKPDSNSLLAARSGVRTPGVGKGGGRTFLDPSRPTPKPIQRRVKLGESGSGIALKKHTLLAPGLSMGRPIHIPTLCALLGCYGKALKYTLSFSHKIVALR